MSSNTLSNPWNSHSVAPPTSALPFDSGNTQYHPLSSRSSSSPAAAYPGLHQRTDSASSTESLSTNPSLTKVHHGSNVYSSIPSNIGHKAQTISSPFAPRSPLQTGRQHPFSSSFEAPDWKLISTHVILSLLAFPILFVFTIIARDKTLFWTRFLVSVGCGLVGFCLGLSLINLGRAFLEAATWSTLIHQSQVDSSAGIKLKDFAALSDDSSSAWTALRLLWNRSMYTGTARSRRKSYDSRLWSLYIAFFLFLVTAAAATAFILGRIVDIDTRVEHQSLRYREVSVKGDLSENDITQAKAIQRFFNDFTLTWTLSGFASEDNSVSPVSFPWENDAVYFAEVTRSQLQPDGHGLGTFDVNHTRDAAHDQILRGPGNSDPSKPVEPGTVLRFPRWGIRIHCRKIPNLERNIVPLSANKLAYMFTPRDVLRDLFSSFSIDLPDNFNQPFDPKTVLMNNDTLPNGIDIQNAALGARFSDNGVAHSFKSDPISMGEDGRGFVALEALLVRLNTSYTPNAKFPVLRNDSTPDASGRPSIIGYDGAICLELFEPWILETYNTTFGSPTSIRIVGKGNEIKDAASGEINTGIQLNDVKRQLNSSQLSSVYDVAHGNSVNQLLKDNGRDAPYVPNPTVISFTNGQGPEGYTELSESFFAEARAKADALHILAYLAGTGDAVARAYPDLVLSSASMNYMYMGIFVASVLLLGLGTGLFVPKLPLGVPRRGFELYSWVAALYGDGVGREIHKAGVHKNMELQEVEKRLGDVKFHLAV